jgi:hypothetical protein
MLHLAAGSLPAVQCTVLGAPMPPCLHAHHAVTAACHEAADSDSGLLVTSALLHQVMQSRGSCILQFAAAAQRACDPWSRE